MQKKAEHEECISCRPALLRKPVHQSNCIIRVSLVRSCVFHAFAYINAAAE